MEQCAGFGEPFFVIGVLQAFHHGFLDDFLNIGGTHQLRADTLCTNRESCVPRKNFFPGNGAHALEQILVALRGKLTHHQHNPVSGAQPQIGAKSHVEAAFKACAANVHYLNVFRAQSFQVLACHALQAEGGAGNPFHLFYISHSVEDFF